MGAGGSGDSCRRPACRGSPRLRLVFPLDRADSLSHPHITERVFPFDLDPLFPQISFSKRRRTLQDPPEGRGVDSGAGLLIDSVSPCPAQIWRSARTPCATLSLHWTALWKWTSTAGPRYLAVMGPHSGEGGDSRGRGRGLDPHRGRLRGRALASWQLLDCEMRWRCGGTWPLIPRRGSPFSGQADPRTWGFLQIRLTLCFPLMSLLLWKSAGEVVGDKADIFNH